jgi:hypothetical protein
VFEVGWSSLYGPFNNHSVLFCTCITAYQQSELLINVRLCLTAQGLNRLFLLESVFPGHSVIAIHGELLLCTLYMHTTLFRVSHVCWIDAT